MDQKGEVLWEKRTFSIGRLWAKKASLQEKVQARRTEETNAVGK